MREDLWWLWSLTSTHGQHISYSFPQRIVARRCRVCTGEMLPLSGPPAGLGCLRLGCWEAARVAERAVFGLCAGAACSPFCASSRCVPGPVTLRADVLHLSLAALGVPGVRFHVWLAMGGQRTENTVLTVQIDASKGINCASPPPSLFSAQPLQHLVSVQRSVVVESPPPHQACRARSDLHVLRACERLFCRIRSLPAIDAMPRWR